MDVALARDVSPRWRSRAAFVSISSARATLSQGELPVNQVVTRTSRIARKEGGLEGFRFLDLRHNQPSWNVQSETPIAIVKEIGGWASRSRAARQAAALNGG